MIDLTNVDVEAEFHKLLQKLREEGKLEPVHKFNKAVLYIFFNRFNSEDENVFDELLDCFNHCCLKKEYDYLNTLNEYDVNIDFAMLHGLITGNKQDGV